jgi:hypothetical protein
VTLPVACYGDQMLKLTADFLNKHQTLAIGIDPVAEAVCVFEKLGQSRPKWTMPSTASIAIVILHTLLTDVYPGMKRSWHVVVQPSGYVVCEPMFRFYCELMQIKQVSESPED